MKSWIIGLVILLLLVIGGVYFFIPSTLTISRVAMMRCNAEGAFRALKEDSSWDRWWPAGGTAVRLHAGYYPHVVMSVADSGDSLPGEVLLVGTGGTDSVALQWKLTMDGGGGPIDRVRQYFRAVGVRDQMVAALDKMKSDLERKEFIYHMKVREGMSKDSTLAVMDLRTAGYPSTEEIYKVIGKLRGYISGRQAQEIDAPMLHVAVDSAGGYKSIIAIPVDRALPAQAAIYPLRYVPWKVVIGEVRGGAKTAELAMGWLEAYLHDHRRIAMAMPHQVLVTERDQEPDTTLWVTQVIQAVP